MRNFYCKATKCLCSALLALCCFSGAAVGDPVSGIVATVTLSNLNFTYDGTQKSATCDTIPLGLATAITYSDLVWCQT